LARLEEDVASVRWALWHKLRRKEKRRYYPALGPLPGGPAPRRRLALDLYYMPYTHSLVAALLWSVAAAATYRLLGRSSNRRSCILVAAAVFSHWVLDLVVHRPDLPLFDDAAKVGLGLWNRPALAFGLEAALLVGAVALFQHARAGRWVALVVFSLVMLAIQAYIFFGPPPVLDVAIAATALAAYGAFALVIWLLTDRRPATRAP
jgi:membrane-bound metal-dependent hydrolase YbcI (DUF457 family)